jgi:hypothetical protein
VKDNTYRENKLHVEHIFSIKENLSETPNSNNIKKIWKYSHIYTYGTLCVQAAYLQGVEVTAWEDGGIKYAHCSAVSPNTWVCVPISALNFYST